MKTIDDLRTTLDDYADRGDACGADEVWTAANADPAVAELAERPDGSHHPLRALLVAAAAAIVLIVGTLVVTRDDRSTDVTTVPDPDGAADMAVPIAPRPIVVPDGRVANVDAAHGRIWVTNALDLPTTSSKVRSFDPESGRQLSEATLPGRFVGAASTDGAYWVRTDEDRWDLVDPATGAPFSGHLFRIDPTTGDATLRFELRGGGSLAARGSRLAMSDSGVVQTYDETDEGSVVTTPLADAMGPGFTAEESPDQPGLNTFGYAALAFGPTALYGLDQMTGLLIEMDPVTGAYRSSQPIGLPGTVYPHLAVTSDRVWVSAEGALTGRPLDLAPAADPVILLDNYIVALTTTTDDDLIAVSRSWAMVVAGASPYPVVHTPIVKDLEYAAAILGGRPWVAQWPLDQRGAPVTITFVEAATSPDPAVPPPMIVPLTVTTRPPGGGGPQILVGSEPLVDGTTYPIAIVGVAPFARGSLKVCHLASAGASDTCWIPFGSGPDGMVADGGMGETLHEWTARRSVYGDRWYDCAVESCVLRLYALDAAGGVDETTVLAETPLTFAADTPPRRPSLTVTPAGPIAVGSTVTISADALFPNARGINIGLCATGRSQTTCRYGVETMTRIADADGRLTVTFTIQRGTIEMPALDADGEEVVGEVIDCTAAPGACSFSVFLAEGSQEPYATVSIEMIG